MSVKKQVIEYIIVFFVVVISFFVATSVFKNKPRKINSKDDIIVKYKNSDIVELENKLPISDTFGRKLTGTGTEEGIQGYVEFSVINSSSKDLKYEIYLTKQNIYDSEIKDSYIKLYLTDFDDVPYSGFEKNMVPTYDKLNYLSDYVSSKRLFSDTLKANKERKFRLRVWISDSYVISKNTEFFGFDIDVRTI